MKSLSGSFKSALYWFVLDIMKGNLSHPDWDFKYVRDFNEVEGLREEFDEVISDPEVMKKVFTVWSNNIELDQSGNVVNTRHARLRAFQYLRCHFDPRFPEESVSPQFEPWEECEYEFEDSGKNV